MPPKNETERTKSTDGSTQSDRAVVGREREKKNRSKSCSKLLAGGVLSRNFLSKASLNSNDILH